MAGNPSYGLGLSYGSRECTEMRTATATGMVNALPAIRDWLRGFPRWIVGSQQSGSGVRWFDPTFMARRCEAHQPQGQRIGG